MDKNANAMNQDELKKILQEPFYSLIFSLYNSAAMSLGKIPNPITNKTESDLDQAHVTIEMLGMLKEKTTGNLSDQEQQFLSAHLSELRLSFAEAVKQSKPGE